MALCHFCKNTVNYIDILTVVMGVVDYGKLLLSTHFGNETFFSPDKPASSMIKNTIMIIFEKPNPALPGFLASRSLYFSVWVENQTCIIICMPAGSLREITSGPFPRIPT